MLKNQFKLFFISIILFSLVSCDLIGKKQAGSSEISNVLKFNLSNLNGEWGFQNKKGRDEWWLQICYNDANKNGTYILSRRPDSWGSDTKSEIKTISVGSFNLVEGFDLYGDKAYLAKNTSNGQQIFAVTQLDNKYAIDWLLKICEIEKEMFGLRMDKLSNECK